MTEKELLEKIDQAARDGRTKLDLSGENIKSLPKELGKLANLTVLDLSINELTSVPPEIGELTNLKELNLYDNQLTSVPPQLGKLTNLTWLDLSNNQLTSLPPQLGKLTNLMGFYLFRNQLASVPPQLGQLTNLMVFNLSNNQLTSVPPQLGRLMNLTELDLDNNQLTSLPAEILELNMEIKWKWEAGKKGIFLAYNPWEKPPVETIKRGKDAIRAWFEALEEEGGRRLNEVKVLLVGYGGAGKTSFVRRLTTGKFKKNEPKTHGVKRTDWKTKADGEDITVHFWDYGGQGIMQATPGFLFTTLLIYSSYRCQTRVGPGRMAEKYREYRWQIACAGGNQ